MIRAGSLPARSLSVAPRWWKRDALFELPLAHHSVAAVDDDHAHRRNQPCGKTAGIVLERPASFLCADEPAYTLALAVIVIHSHRKLLSLTHGPASSTQKQGGNGLPPYCCGMEAYCEFLRRLNAVRPAQVKLIQCRDVRHSRPVMEVFVAPGIGFGLWTLGKLAHGFRYPRLTPGLLVERRHDPPLFRDLQHLLLNEMVARRLGAFFAFARLGAVLVGLALRHRTLPKNLDGCSALRPPKRIHGLR